MDLPPALTITVAVAGGLFVLFLVLSVVLKRTGGYAPGWRVRCLDCDATRPAAEAGIVRVGATRSKYTILRCEACGKARRTVIEREPGQME